MPPLPKSKVVVLVSADIEWRILRSLTSASDEHLSPLGEWFIEPVQVGAEVLPILFFHGGWGKISAAATAQYVVDRCEPTLVVNLGTCGGFQGEVEKGTILLVDRVVVYDIFEQIGDHDAHINHYTTDLGLDWLQQPYPHEVLRTHLVSGDRDLRANDIAELTQEFGAVAGDWESGSIAWVTARNGVRCLILRGVSDLVGAGGGEAYGNIGLFEDNARRILRRLLDQLPDWLAAGKAL